MSNEPAKDELVEVMTDGGTKTINVTDSIENGLLDAEQCESTSDILGAVRTAIWQGDALNDRDGNRTLIMAVAVSALTYLTI